MTPIGKKLPAVALVATVLGMSSGMEVAAQLGMSSSSGKTSGHIASIELRRGVLKLAPATKIGQPALEQKEPTTIFVGPQTSISKDSRSLRLEELKVGDRVEVEYQLQDNKHVARSVIVQPAAAETPRNPQTPLPPPGPQ